VVIPSLTLDRTHGAPFWLLDDTSGTWVETIRRRGLPAPSPSRGETPEEPACTLAWSRRDADRERAMTAIEVTATALAGR